MTLRRNIVPEMAYHVICRGNNKQRIFYDTQDFLIYHEMIVRNKRKFGLTLFHYVFMNNHLHLVLRTPDQSHLSEFMHRCTLGYTYHMKKRYGFVGQFWQGRYRLKVITDMRYLVTCGIYVELNPVRAKLVVHPEDYKWSSYRANALNMHDSAVDTEELFCLATDTARSYKEYRELVETTRVVDND